MAAGLILLVGGLVVLITSFLSKTDRLPRNHWVGVRTRTTMRDDDTWRAAHRASWAYVAAAGLVTMGLGVYMVLNPEKPPAIWVLLPLVLVPTIVAGFVAQAAAKKVVASYKDQ